MITMFNGVLGLREGVVKQSKALDDLLMMGVKIRMDQLLNPESKSKFAGKVLLSVPEPKDKTKILILPPGTIASLKQDTDLGVGTEYVGQDGKKYSHDEAMKTLTEEFLDAVLVSHPLIVKGELVPIVRLDTLVYDITGTAPSGAHVGKPLANVIGVSTKRAEEIRLRLKAGDCNVSVDL